MRLCRFSPGLPAGSQPKSDCARWHYKPAQRGPFAGSRRTQHRSLRFWLGRRPCVLVRHKPRQNLERQQQRQRPDRGELFTYPSHVFNWRGRCYSSRHEAAKLWHSFKLTGPGPPLFASEQIFDSGVTVTESLAVDWVGRNLYWTDYVLETIEVSRLDGAHRTVLVSENVTNPRALVLDPRSRWVISTEVGLL